MSAINKSKLTINKPKNRLLAALPAEEYARLLPKLEEFPLIYAETIYEPNDIIRRVYFPESGIISLLSTVGENSLLEVGIVGSEGFIGLPVFLGVETSNNLAIVQGAGAALTMKTTDFLAECKNGDALSRLLQRYTHSLIAQISQSAVCNRFHAIEARLARWLLMTGDRMLSNEFQITQEFLSNMLGVRREAVNKSATVFQRSNLISYNRGKVSILDRAGLKAAACRCYFIIKEEYENSPAQSPA
ncbi:MAG: Crp/Fnr family transcriptional regulator [Pyrinomonadaceae bacterium]|nr:Crp/Fnr family transcriptional regulator [Pyrinomonadaceae bacterium]